MNLIMIPPANSQLWVHKNWNGWLISVRAKGQPAIAHDGQIPEIYFLRLRFRALPLHVFSL